jgi:hypothetical protein
VTICHRLTSRAIGRVAGFAEAMAWRVGIC